jgi:hypothetical protein
MLVRRARVDGPGCDGARTGPPTPGAERAGTPGHLQAGAHAPQVDRGPPPGRGARPAGRPWATCIARTGETCGPAHPTGAPDRCPEREQPSKGSRSASTVVRGSRRRSGVGAGTPDDGRGRNPGQVDVDAGPVASLVHPAPADGLRRRVRPGAVSRGERRGQSFTVVTSLRRTGHVAGRPFAGLPARSRQPDRSMVPSSRNHSQWPPP